MSEENPPTLKIENMISSLRPYLNDRACSILDNRDSLEYASTPEMFSFGRIYHGDMTDADYKDYADRINGVVNKLDGRKHPFGENEVAPLVNAALSTPLRIPLAIVEGGMKRTLVASFLFVRGLPFWEYVDGNTVVFDLVAARKLLRELVGEFFTVVAEGELPPDGVPQTSLQFDVKPEDYKRPDLHHSQGVEVAAVLSGVDMEKTK